MREPSSPLLKRAFYRSGPDQRTLLGGVIPDFLTIRQWFGFRGVEIGKWVTRAEQEQAAGLFFDALCDLTQILAGRPLTPTDSLLLGQSLISLRGTLALQYSSGGRPGVSAHYAPLQQSFALAKNAGPGSIAHEWFHAFDYHMAAKAYGDAGPLDFASKLWVKDKTLKPHRLNQLLAACYAAVLLDDEGQAPSDLFRASAAKDKELNTFYYSQPEECCARAFEAFVQDASIKNAFLVKGTQKSADAEAGLYPQGRQRLAIKRAFSRYFSALCDALLAQSLHEKEAEEQKHNAAEPASQPGGDAP
ncbi:CLCA_X family protein [Thalassolituus sp. LLYu03]|uniref:CLCA_X family protein n=1 Tax=Thalassolituus sp. LLYu03 TaxID=3421656 RepID=UPI003D28EDF1